MKKYTHYLLTTLSIIGLLSSANLSATPKGRVSSDSFSSSAPADSQEVRIPAYLEPNTKSSPFTEISVHSPILGEASPVPNTKEGESQWYWLQYRTTFTGYIYSENINEDQTLKKGSVIYQSPDTRSKALTIVDGMEKDLDLLDTQDWTLIRLTKPIIVYLYGKEAEKTIVAFKGPANNPLPESTAIIPEKIPGFPQLKIEIIQESTVTDAENDAENATPQNSSTNEAESVTLENEAASSSEKTTPQNLPSVDELPPIESSIPSNFKGTFQKASRRLFVASPPFPFQLMDVATNRRLAYIDTSQLASHRPINEYFDKPVIVYGSPEKKGREVIIKAKNLHLE